MNANELRKLYIEWFRDRYDHAEIKGSSIIPENDPTVLFTTAGMHPLVPFLMGEPHPMGKRLVNVQKCIRTCDIDEVGDETHLTFFEMLGNWSLGDYFKKEALQMSFGFLTSKDGGLGLPLDMLAVSVFEGDSDHARGGQVASRDDESAEIWRELGVPDERIVFLDKAENWWGPAGATGPCGPDTEMFYWTGEGDAPETFDPDDDRWVEIWNDVFMQYFKDENEKFTELDQKNVDTGMGFDRTLAVLNGKKSPFETELFERIINTILDLMGTGGEMENQKKSIRIVADHLRTATFILGDENGVTPSNTDQGYVLRRLIRRAVIHGRKLGIEIDFARKIAEIVVEDYGDFYTELVSNATHIYTEIAQEEEKFKKTLNKGLGVLHKEFERHEGEKDKGVRAFKENFFFEMFATYGFPVEMTCEELTEAGFATCKEDNEYVMEKFNKYFDEHQEKSRAGAEKKFKGGMADQGEDVTGLHTATHLLHQALRQVLGNHVEQKGSNITPERLRFDFTHGEKMTDEQKAEVEKIVNEVIESGVDVECEEMSVEEAKKTGAVGLFESKYGDKVKVYTVGDFSKEICGGPHVENVSELGHFKIKKEKSSSSGVRRIKAVLE